MRCPGCGAMTDAGVRCAHCDGPLPPPEPPEAQRAALDALVATSRTGTDAEVVRALEAWSPADAPAVALDALTLLLQLARSTSERRMEASSAAYELLLPQLDLLEAATAALTPRDRARLQGLRRSVRRATDPAQAERDTRLGLVVFATIGLFVAAILYGLFHVAMALLS